MSLIKFIFSKTFLVQILLAIGVLVVLAFLTMQWLSFTTNQDQRIAVPDLSSMSLKRVELKLDELDLRYEVLDSANYNADYPPYSVIDQVPKAGKFVKENRKIYLTLNPSGYTKVEVPDLIRRTKLQAEPTLRSLGFKIGEETYKPDIAKDAVLELRHNGELVQPGDKLMKTAVIDLVLGDGSGRYTENTSKEDSLGTSEDKSGDDGEF
ncbi:MAG: PASTA domain-containing protein [Gillisia sp.]